MSVNKPLAIDLFCGLGGWTEGLLAEGFEVIGFDIEIRPYPAQLVIQDVLTLHGSQFRNAALIVASPPCQAYSYRAMPWKRAKALPPPSNELFDACFRIQREASEASSQYIPMVVENVRGAERWVGRASGKYGSFYLWGDLPALMPICRSIKAGHPERPYRDGHKSTAHLTNRAEHSLSGIKQPGLSGGGWFYKGAAAFSSRSNARKAASAQIATIPFPLAQHIARVYRPEVLHVG